MSSARPDVKNALDRVDSLAACWCSAPSRAVSCLIFRNRAILSAFWSCGLISHLRLIHVTTLMRIKRADSRSLMSSSSLTLRKSAFDELQMPPNLLQLCLVCSLSALSLKIARLCCAFSSQLALLLSFGLDKSSLLLGRYQLPLSLYIICLFLHNTRSGLISPLALAFEACCEEPQTSVLTPHEPARALEAAGLQHLPQNQRAFGASDASRRSDRHGSASSELHRLADLPLSDCCLIVEGLLRVFSGFASAFRSHV